jgi:hypothetical protein
MIYIITPIVITFLWSHRAAARKDWMAFCDDVFAASLVSAVTSYTIWMCS